MIPHLLTGCALLIGSVFFPFISVFAGVSSPFIEDVRYRSAYYWIYIDKTGNFITHDKFDTANDFSEGLAAIRVGERVGYINRNGKIVIKPVYCDGGPFTSGLAYVASAKTCLHIINYEHLDIDTVDLATVTFGMIPMNQRKFGKDYGYINTKGSFVLKPKFGIARPFREGFAVVAFEGMWRYVDHQGRFLSSITAAGIVPPTDFSQGLAAAPFSDSYKWLFFDKNEKVAFKTDFAVFVERFSDGFAKVFTPSQDNEIMYIGLNGKYLGGGYIFKDGGNFSEGLVPVRSNDGCWHYENKAGNSPFEWCLESAREFSEGLAAVKFKDNGMWGFLDKSGQIKIRPIFQDARKFSDGLAAIKLEGKWGYIGRDGKIQIKPSFAEAREFSEDRAAVAMSR